MSSNLTYNILTFEIPSKSQTFYFSEKEIIGSHRIHYFLFPEEVKAFFNKSLPSIGEDCFLYTTFNNQSEGLKAINIDLQLANQAFIKRYFNYQIYNHFKSQRFLINNNFIRDNTIWLKLNETEELTIYDKYSIKIQQKVISDGLELLVVYNGQSKVLKKSINQLKSIPPEHIGLVIHKNEINNYHKVSSEDFFEYEHAYPIVNLDIVNDLGWPLENPRTDNKYKTFKDKITFFLKNYLKTDGFKAIVNITPSFIKVNPTDIDQVHNESNLLLFGNKGIHTDAWQGIKSNGPYKRTPHTKVHFFFILHEDDKQAALAFDNYLEKGFAYFNGLEKIAKINYYTVDKFSIVFKDKVNPIPEIKKQLSERGFKQEIEYFAIYLSPYEKHERNKKLREIYYDIKKLLLKENIHSQAINIQKMMLQGNNYWYSMRNIAVAILAKLNAIPWRIQTPLKNELVVGVGAFKNIDSGLQYIGSSFCFANTGRFQEFDCMVNTNTSVLAGSIHEAIVRYASINNHPDRLIIHFYKTMSKAEIKPIQDKLYQLGLDIPVYIISINKTQSTDIIAWDNEWGNLMPTSGTYIKVGEKRYLLFNNTRYNDVEHKGTDGYPFPVKLHISCTQPDKIDDEITKELIDQVYQFSRMYWKSVKQQHLPITIKYPEMLAEIFPHFNSSDIPEFGKDKLWFL